MNRRSLLGKLAQLPAVAAVAVVPLKAEAPDHVWHAADGRVIPYRELTDNHLLNIERMLRGDGLRGTQWLDDESIGEGHGAKGAEHRAILAEVTRRGLATRPAFERPDPLLAGDDLWWMPQDDWSPGSW